MGRYYNKTRGILPVTLASGAPLSVPAKSWVTIPVSEENSSSIANAVRRGFLVRSTISDDAPPPTPDPMPVAKAEPVQPVVAEKITVVQNQIPKVESPAKSTKLPAKSDITDEKLTDEPKHKRE
jgi:hypothetical protein